MQRIGRHGCPAKKFIRFLGLITALSILIVYILPENSRITRFPAILEWVHRFLLGEFPYESSTNPSGFPVLFVLAIPFYYLGNIGLLKVVGIFLFGIVILYNREQGVQTAWVQFLVLLLLPILYYEIITRSELFFNMALALAVIVMADSYIAESGADLRFILLAIAFGLVLSTRLIIAPVYAIFVVYKFKANVSRGLLFSVIVLFTFVSTLLPFLIWDPVAFTLHGPFRIQFAYLPVWGVIAAIVASIIFGFTSKNIKDMVSFAGLTIFGVVALAFFLVVNRMGFVQVIFMDRFDISYFILSVPFLLFGLSHQFVADPPSSFSVN